MKLGRSMPRSVSFASHTASSWGEIRSVAGARQLAGAKPWRMCGRGLCGWGQFDGVAELFELADQAAGLVLFVVAVEEVVLAEVSEHLAGGEQVPGHIQQAVSDRDGCLVRAAAAGYLPVLGAEVAALGPCRGPGRLDQRVTQPRVARPGGHHAALAG